MRLARYLVSAAIAVAGTAMIAPAHAHSPSHPDMVGNLDALAGAAKMTFQGKVERVDYRLSRNKDGSAGIPYTFVTYSVGKVMQGRAAAAKITLRFAGGPDGQGGFVDVEGVPLFQPGDEDILFVRSNGTDGCPLVECEFGRYRVLGGAVFEAHGTPVAGIKNGRVSVKGETPIEFQSFSYPAPKFEDLVKRKEVRAAIKKAGLTLKQARARYNKEAPKTIRTQIVDPLLGAAAAASNGKAGAPVKAMGVDAFVAGIGSTMAAQPQSVSVPLVSASVDDVIDAPIVQAIKPRAPSRGAHVATGKTIRKK